jgi:AraC-like DNA-binding protein
LEFKGDEYKREIIGAQQNIRSGGVNEVDDRFSAASTAEVRAKIARAMSKLHWDGLNLQHNIPGLTLYRVEQPAGPFSTLYEPSVAVTVSGSKIMSLGGEASIYDETNYFLTAIGLPMKGQIDSANPSNPYLAAVLRLDMEMARRLIIEHELYPVSETEQVRGAVSGVATATLFDAFLRLILSNAEPERVAFYSKLIQQEILYHLLTGESGNQFRCIALAEHNHRVSKAISWIKANYQRPLRIDELASYSSMGVSTLHHHFRSVTAMSPLQFQKHLRLHHARLMMLTGKIDASTVALEVGYESVTQFNREYRRMFGHPPLRDVKILESKRQSQSVMIG